MLFLALGLGVPLLRFTPIFWLMHNIVCSPLQAGVGKPSLCSQSVQQGVGEVAPGAHLLP